MIDTKEKEEEEEWSLYAIPKQEKIHTISLQDSWILIRTLEAHFKRHLVRFENKKEESRFENNLGHNSESSSLTIKA